MKVSFLVTYYNQEQYVKKSLESILALEKTYDWEILVGDDGSIDRTVEEVNKYIASYPDQIKLTVMPRKQDMDYYSVKRVSNSRLTLLEKATGDFFCVLDGDDFYIDGTFVKEAIKIFQNNKELSVVAYAYCDYKNGKIGKEISLTKESSGNVIDTIDYIKTLYIHAGACVFKKTFDCNRINALKDIGYYDDNDIVINNLCYGNIFAVNKPVYAYRQTGVSVYTGMNCLEQAVLNVQGYDVDCSIAPKFADALRYRNRKAIIYTFLLRRKIKHLLGNKWSMYFEASRTIPDAIVIKLLDYEALDKDQMAQLDGFMLKFMIKNMKTSVKTIIEILKG